MCEQIYTDLWKKTGRVIFSRAIIFSKIFFRAITSPRDIFSQNLLKSLEKKITRGKNVPGKIDRKKRVVKILPEKNAVRKYRVRAATVL